MARSHLVWVLLLVIPEACTFDPSGLAVQGDDDAAPDGQRDIRLILTDGPPGSEARPDLQLTDGEPADLQPIDQLAPDTPSPCVGDDFLTDMPGWAVSLLKGDWSWLPPTHAHHQLPAIGYRVGEAQIDGSPQLLGAPLTGEATLTLDAVYQNGNAHGAGLALLIKDNGSTSIADTLVACVVRQSSATGQTGVSIWYFSGGSNSAKSLGNGSNPGTSLFQTPVKLTMTLVPLGGTSFTMTCALDAAGKQDSTTADISSYVDIPPFGVALVSFGATVDFDEVRLCP